MKADDETEEKTIRELRQRIAELESENKHQREMEKLLVSENKYREFRKT